MTDFIQWEIMIGLPDEPKTPPRLDTDRLVLDGHRTNDLGPLAVMWADERIVHHVGGRASTGQESWFRLLRYRCLWPVLGYGYWASREKQSSRLMGDFGLADFGGSDSSGHESSIQHKLTKSGIAGCR